MRIGLLAELFGSCGISIGLETGQEAAATLLSFLREVNRPNLGVNFDPANMLLYGSGEPIPALRELGPYVRQVHLKDARPSGAAGVWGTEVPLGEGDVDWQGFFACLREMNFIGGMIIEREGGEQRIRDVRRATEFVGAAA